MPSEMAPRVLVVGEDEAQRVALASALRAAGHLVEEAPGVAAGCGVLRRRRVAAVIADVAGPEAGGLAITRAARRGAPPAGAVILLPARGDASEYALPALERDAYACLRHPVTPEHIVATVGRAVEDYLRRTAPGRTAARASATEPAVAAAGAAVRPLSAGAIRAWARLVDSLAAAADPEALDSAAARMALELAGAVEAWTFAWDEAGRPQRAPAHAGRNDSPPGAPPTALAIEARLARRPVARPEAARILGAAPVHSGTADAGALVVALPPGADFGADVAAPLAALAAEVALARRALDAERRAEESVQGLMTGLMTAVGLRDGYTRRHSQRVQRLAVDLARVLGIPEGSTEMATLRRGAALHDIGKFAVPDAVLHKPGTLDDDEWVAMRAHAEAGARIVRDIPALREVAALIVASHERWDGGGYPRGLAGEAIPLGARVCMLADAWDAMTTDRPYRRALPVDAAVEEIHRHRGTQFDPRVVEAFDRVVEKWIREFAKEDRWVAA